MSSENLQLIVDRLAIDDLLTRYATAVDRRDWDLYRTCFTDDAVIDYTSAGGIRGGLDEVAGWLAQVMPVFSMTQHLVTNRAIEIAGDEARAESYFFNPLGLLGPDGKQVLYFDGGTYSDRLRRTEAGWRIYERIETSAYTTRTATLGTPAKG